MIGLLALAVVAIAIAGAVHIGRRLRSDADDERDRSPRRVLHVLFLFIALISAASGLTRVAGIVLSPRAIAGAGAEDLALGLSLTLVAVPAWVVLWLAARRRLAADPAERRSTAWAAYVVVACTVTLVVAFVNFAQVGAWLVAVEDYRGSALAGGLVWGAAWAGHRWLLERSAVAPTGPWRTLAPLAGSAVGLITLGVGTIGVASYGLTQGYRALVGPALVEIATTEQLRGSLVVAVLAAAVWWWHWLQRALRAARTTAWYVYVLGFGVLGGLLLAVAAATAMGQTVLRWVIGESFTADAATHFDVVPAMAAVLLVGGGAWWYHDSVLRRGSAPISGAPLRSYRYLVAGVGLTAATAGVTVLLVAAIQAVAPAPLAASDAGGGDALAVGLPLTVVGAPLWGAIWWRVQQRVHDGDLADLQDAPRRVYLFATVGVTGLTAAGALVAVLFVVLRDLLEASLAPTILTELRVALALTIACGAVFAYHWTVVRHDRAAAPVVPVRRARRILLVSSDGRALADDVARRTGATVQCLHRLDVQTSDLDAAAVAEAVLASPYDRLLVTVDQEGTVTAIPYDVA